VIVTPATLDHLASNVFVDKWQTVDVTFTAAFTDTVIPHNLVNKNVRFLVMDATAGGDVFRGVIPPQLDYLVVQSNQLGTYHILLYVEAQQAVQSTGTTSSGGTITSPTPANPLLPIQSMQVGTWVPVIGGTGGTSGQTYTTQVGTFLKIGRLVMVEGRAILSAKGTITGNVQVQGLPFPTATGSNDQVIAARINALATTWVSLQLAANATATAWYVVGRTVAAAQDGLLVTADITNTTDITMTGTFITN
jgi:hypothetical protein